jgi:F0F1-type ATP synthase assembly protein I
MAKDSNAIYRSLALVGSLGWTVLICVVLGAFLGTFVDNTFRIGPVFLLVGVVLGVAGGFWQCYRLVVRAMGEDESEQDDNG